MINVKVIKEWFNTCSSCQFLDWEYRAEDNKKGWLCKKYNRWLYNDTNVLKSVDPLCQLKEMNNGRELNFPVKTCSECPYLSWSMITCSTQYQWYCSHNRQPLMSKTNVLKEIDSECSLADMEPEDVT